MKTNLITTPIYYVNDRPHIGHAYTTVLADVLARYHRFLGTPAFLLTGTDEHGQKVLNAATKAGISPQEHADRNVKHFHDLWRKLGIRPDDFIRTTETRHKDRVQTALSTLLVNGDIYLGEHDGLYDVSSETFVTQNEVTANNPNIIHLKETNYFFKMAKHQQWLIDYIHANPSFIQPESRRNETLGFLQKPLHDLCISRPKSRLSWGIELPFDPNYVTYVWFDALLNYLCHQELWPASVQLVGKDILLHHTVYWPIMLKVLGLPPPQSVFAHGWWTSNDNKIGKSAGNAVSPDELIQKYGADGFRFLLMSEMIPGADANYSEESFTRKYNSFLANDLGNLANRTASMIQKYCGGNLPVSSIDQTLLKPAKSLLKRLPQYVQNIQIDKILDCVYELTASANAFLEKRQPWKQAKETDQKPLWTTLGSVAEVVRVVAAVMAPIMPSKSEEIRNQLGYGTTTKDDFNPNSTIFAEYTTLAKPIFPRIEKP